MPGARRDRFEPLERNQEAQFGGITLGVGGIGIGIPVVGAGGFIGGGIRGGLIPGGFVQGAGSGINPVLTLEGAFGVGFTSQDIADQIEVAQQTGALQQGGIIDIATGPAVSLVLNLARGLFEILDNVSGNVLGRGVTGAAAIEAVRAGGGPGIPQVTGGAAAQPQIFPDPLDLGPSFQAPPPELAQIASPEALAAFVGLLGELFRRQDPIGTIFFPRADPVIPPFPPLGPIPGLPPLSIPQRVAPGGTVNVPRVLGATGDPAGVRRPRFPDQEQLTRAQQIGNLIAQFIGLRKARQNADKQRRAFEQFLANRLQQLRGQAMPFGQAGFAAGPLLGAGAGELIQTLIGAGAGFLGERFGQQAAQQFPALPAFPTGLQGPLLGPQMGGGGACPPLFRGGGSVLRMSPVPWFPIQAPNGKWFFFGHLGTPKFSKLKSPRRHHHHPRRKR